MRAIGIVRRVDDLGRIVIPKELRQAMGINEGSPMEIFANNDQVIMRKYQPGCVFCGNLEGLTIYEGKNICPACIAKLSGKARKPA